MCDFVIVSKLGYLYSSDTHGAAQAIILPASVKCSINAPSNERSDKRRERPKTNADEPVIRRATSNFLNTLYKNRVCLTLEDSVKKQSIPPTIFDNRVKFEDCVAARDDVVPSVNIDRVDARVSLFDDDCVCLQRCCALLNLAATESDCKRQRQQ